MDINLSLTDDQNSNLEIVGNEIRVGGELAVGTYTLTLTASNESGWSQTLAQTLTVEEPIPSWVPRDYLGAPVPFVLDAQNNRGWLGETEYSSEANFLAASGVSGVLASGIRTFGPYDVPSAVNEFPGTPDLSNTTALAAFGTGGAIQTISGELELTVGGTGAGWRFSLPLARKAYRWRVKGRKGTSTGGNITPTSSINSGMTGGLYYSNTLFSASMTELGVIIPSATTGQRYCGARQQNGFPGTHYFDDAALTEVKPFALFNQAEGTICVEGMADSSGTDQVLAEIANTMTGQAGDRDYIRVMRNASSGDITCTVVVGTSSVYTQSLGTVANGGTIRLSLGWKDAALGVSLNGSTPFMKGSATQIESHAVMRFGGTFNGTSLANAWAGFRKGYYLPTQQPNWWLQHASSGFAATDIWTEGDSYMAGAGGVSLSGAIRGKTGRIVIDTAAGGSTMTQVRDRLLANPDLRGKTLVIWDGSANSYMSVAYTCSLIDAIIAYHGNPAKIIYIPSASVGPSTDGLKTAYTLDMEAIRDYAATTGIQTFDPVPILNAVATGTAQDLLDISAGVVCQSLLQDTVHLKQPPMDAVASTVKSIIDTNGL